MQINFYLRNLGVKLEMLAFILFFYALPLDQIRPGGIKGNFQATFDITQVQLIFNEDEVRAKD